MKPSINAGKFETKGEILEFFGRYLALIDFLKPRKK